MCSSLAQPPQELRCPITNILMNEPVMAADGFTYERAAITDWIEFHRTSPKTGAQISPHLFPNIEKKSQVDHWRASQPTPMSGSEMEAMLSPIAWANSSQDVSLGLLNLSALVAQKQVLVPAQQMRRMRLCLSADETIWCRQVQQLLDDLDTQCSVLAGILNTNLQMSRMAARQAVLTAEGMVTSLEQQQTALTAAEEQVRMLKRQLRISQEGPKKMRQVEAGYSTQAEGLAQDLSCYSKESIVQAEAEARDGETRKRPLCNESDVFWPAKRWKEDTEALLEEAMSMDYDIAKERVLTELAAEQEDPVAVARCIQSGWGGLQHDPVEAFNMLVLLEKDHQHSRAAQCYLAECYEYGLGVETNLTQAFGRYVQAAQAGLARAQCSLGACYRDGIGTGINGDKACQWFMAASKQNHARAHVCLGTILQKMQQNQSAFDCFRKAADLGHSFAECWIGQAFHKGLDGVTIADKARAAEWFAKAAEQGDAQAQCCLGEYYQYGVGVSVNTYKAANWFAKSASQGHERTKYHFDKMRRDGNKGTDRKKDVKPTQSPPIPVPSTATQLIQFGSRTFAVPIVEPIDEPLTDPQNESLSEPSTPPQTDSLSEPSTPPQQSTNRFTPIESITPLKMEPLKIEQQCTWAPTSRAEDFASRLSNLLTRTHTKAQGEGGRLVSAAKKRGKPSSSSA